MNRNGEGEFFSLLSEISCLLVWHNPGQPSRLSSSPLLLCSLLTFQAETTNLSSVFPLPLEQTVLLTLLETLLLSVLSCLSLEITTTLYYLSLHFQFPEKKNPCA